jgi:preprotein translocase subunit SecF
MRWGRTLLTASMLLVLAAAVVTAVRGINLGIEFTGGTEVHVKYASRPDIAEIRAAVEKSGLRSPVVTTIGDPAENEVYIRLGTATVEEAQVDLTTRIAQVLRGTSEQPGRQDLNVVDQVTLGRLLMLQPDLTAADAEAVAASVVRQRKERAVFRSIDEIEGLSPAVRDYLAERAYVGPLAVRSQSYIGPAVGKELMNKARIAIVLSLITMLLYIWLRFQFQWGLAAVLALVHDTVLTLGLFALFDLEMSLPVVAAFLTLVGYSVNDTVVIFDRVRENLRNRVGGTLEEILNLSINQTLSRTVITQVLTWLVVFVLYLFGGAALKPFAFVLTVGIIVGGYSTICIASPFLLLWKQFMERRQPGSDRKPVRPTAKKVRTPSSGRA